MARWNLRRAAELRGIEPRERAEWLALAEATVDGYDPRTGIYEQFAGFHGLEPLVIAELAPRARSRRPAARRRARGRRAGAQAGGRADAPPPRPRRGRVELLRPDPGLLRAPNGTATRFRRRSTRHSSRAGRPDDALEPLRLAARIDLDDLTGTAAACTATMGGVWQALAYGFAGVRLNGPIATLDPHLPDA